MQFWGKHLGLAVLLAGLAGNTLAIADDDPVLKFYGRDKSSGRVCELYVWETSFAGDTGKWEDFRATVSTNYKHGDTAPPKLAIKPKDGSTVEGAAKDSTQSLTIVLRKDSKNLASANAFKLKWKHGDHDHNDTCEGLAKD